MNRLLSNDRRGLVVVAGCCLLLGCISSVARSAPPAPDLQSTCAARVLSDVEGSISEIVLHYDLDFESELVPTYCDLFAALPVDIGLTVLCASCEAANRFLRDWACEAARGGRRVRLVNVERDISIWARDRRIARAYHALGVSAATLVPAPPARPEDWQANEVYVGNILNAPGMLPGTIGTRLAIEGGNVVSNGRHVFVGGNVLTEHADEGWPVEAVERELGRVLGGNVILVGGTDGAVPWCHLDMYLTPIGDSTILVASPAFAETVLCAQPSTWQDSLMVEPACDLSDDAWAMQAQYDSVAGQLSALGYRVLRLPTLVNDADGWAVTYNNVVFDEVSGQRVVYMPVYRITALDHVATAIYESLGFEVRPIDVSQVFQWGGAVRCIVNVTARSPGSPPGSVLSRKAASVSTWAPDVRLR
jgi:N-dimethylarginine dimethylaminohydrolase